MKNKSAAYYAYVSILFFTVTQKLGKIAIFQGGLTSILECNCSKVAHLPLFRSLKHTYAIREGRNERRWGAIEQLPFFLL